MAEKLETKHYAMQSQPFLPDRQRVEQLRALLAPGDISTPVFARQLQRLAGAFEHYLAHFPFGVWRRGLVLTAEMHRWTEQYLPLADLWRIWRKVGAAAVRVPCPPMAAEFLALASWLAVLERCRMAVPVAPHELMGRMLQDEEFRQQILFAWHLPQQHGGGFGRYPAQLAWLCSWLKTGRQGRESTISCLDAASGSGEGTYELAAAVFAAGYQPCAITVRGATLQPLEVAAAALALFPHDRPRQAAYRLRVGTICPPELLERISFQQEDLKRESHETNCYTVILCNGLLGGPLLHERCTVLRVLQGLVQRLKTGGILLADDRFHAGWRRVISPGALRELFVTAGLQPVAVPSGIGGICLKDG